jgi:tRNA dimethylallyltransferase
LTLRFKPILIWIKADKTVLEERIRKRVDKMIDQENGLVEIFHVFDTFHSSNYTPLDFSKGILQSIGYKEFYDYYQAQKSDCSSVTLSSAKERLCSKTVSYAQRQKKWL